MVIPQAILFSARNAPRVRPPINANTSRQSARRFHQGRGSPPPVVVSTRCYCLRHRTAPVSTGDSEPREFLLHCAAGAFVHVITTWLPFSRRTCGRARVSKTEAAAAHFSWSPDDYRSTDSMCPPRSVPGRLSMAENAALGQMALSVGLGVLVRYKDGMAWHGMHAIFVFCVAQALYRHGGYNSPRAVPRTLDLDVMSCARALRPQKGLGPWKSIAQCEVRFSNADRYQH